MRNKNKAKRLPDDINKEIEEIIDGLKCPKDFICYKSGFKKLCKVEDTGLESFLVCLNDLAIDCKFSVNFSHVYFCQCPLRMYICRKLKYKKRLTK
jgi:hypothetical protein